VDKCIENILLISKTPAHGMYYPLLPLTTRLYVTSVLNETSGSASGKFATPPKVIVCAPGGKVGNNIQ
jgi:hypothetical protein